MTTHTLKNWRISNLGDTVDIIDGDRGKNYPKQDEFLDSGYCLFLNTKNVPSSSFSFGERMFITKEKDSALRKGKLLRGDFVLTTRGTVGNFAYFSDKVPFENIRINSGMVIMRPKKDGKLLSGFFKSYLDSPLFRDQVKSRSSGSAQPQLPIRDLSTFEIEIPELETQKQIADVLSTYDDLIENNTRRIQILEQMAQAIYTEWFVNFRFPGHEKVKMVDSGSDFGKIPEGWEIIKVGQLLERIQRKNKIKRGEYAREGEFPVIDQGKDLIGGYTSDSESIYQENLPFIIFGDHTRILKYIDFPFACGADGTQLLSSNSERMPMTLFFYALQNIDLSNFHYARHFKFLKEKTVILPDQITASAFDDYARPCRDLIKVLSDRNINLRKTRDLLLPKLVTGEIRV